MIRAAGVDLSLTGTGAVVVPGDWDRDWRRITRASFGVSLSRTASTRDITHRLRDITRDLVRWLLREQVTHVFVENALTQRAFNIVALSELRGVFRVELLEQAGLDAAYVNQSSARKLLLGKLPPKKRKEAVVAALREAGASFEDDDQFDAFTAVNHELEHLGVLHLQELAQAFETKKPKRKRAAKAAA